MPAKLNHTIVNALDPRASAEFVAELFGLAPPFRFGPFHCVELANDVTLDFMSSGGEPITPQHYAFLVSESEFTEIFSRIERRALDYWADPGLKRAGAINRNDGGRGVYFKDPNGHLLEAITRPYGSSDQ